MTKETVNSFKSKILWFVIPFLITFFTWQVVSIYNIDANIKVIQNDGNNREKLQEKIYTNLNNKLDVEIYEVRHNEVIKDIDQLKVKVDKIGNRLNISYTDNFNNNSKSVKSLKNITSNQDTIMNMIEKKNLVEMNHTGISDLVWGDIVRNKSSNFNIYK